MQVKEYRCKCGHYDFFFADKGQQKGIYCSYCGKWLKWADKDEQNLIMKKVNMIGKGLPLQDGGWIPVIEGLPKDREKILFSTKTDNVFEGRFFDDHSDCQWYAFDDEGFVQNYDVIAWMPLPKPYNTEREDRK